MQQQQKQIGMGSARKTNQTPGADRVSPAALGRRRFVHALRHQRQRGLLLGPLRSAAAATRAGVSRCVGLAQKTCSGRETALNFARRAMTVGLGAKWERNVDRRQNIDSVGGLDTRCVRDEQCEEVGTSARHRQRSNDRRSTEQGGLGEWALDLERPPLGLHRGEPRVRLRPAAEAWRRRSDDHGVEMVSSRRRRACNTDRPAMLCSCCLLCSLLSRGGMNSFRCTCGPTAGQTWFGGFRVFGGGFGRSGQFSVSFRLLGHRRFPVPTAGQATA